MSYKICATKRDVNTVGKPLQYFTPSQWIVRLSTGSNAGDYDISDTYQLIKDGEVTSLTLNISPINGCVYEGMQVSAGSGTKLSFGTLLQKEAANQCVTKQKVLDVNCGLTGESAMYASNRLVREEDIVAPSTVSVYYDPRYLIVEEFKTDAVFKASTTPVDPGVPERTPGDALNPLMNREFAYQAIQCTKGNKVKVRQKNTVNSDLVLNSVYAYDNLAEPIYELNAPGYEGVEFIASETCFITFDLVQQAYRLSAAAPVIDCATQWGITISAYIEPDGDVYFLANAGIDDPKVPMCRPSSEEYMLVPNEAEVNVSLHVNTYETANTTTFILRNLTTNEPTTLTLNDDDEYVFKMPSSDCRLETNVVIHETAGDTGFEYEDRILTIKSNQLERVIVNGSTYSFYDGVAEVNISCGESPSALAEVYFDAGIPAVYSIRAYATSQGPVSMPRSQATPHTTLSLSTDMTLEVSYSPISCEYKTIGGEISDLTKGESWSSTNNTITNVLLSNGFYKLITNNPISSTPVNSAFQTKEQLEEVKFNTSNSSFIVRNGAFRECSSLHNVVLPNVSSLSIQNTAFYKCTNLSKLELPYGLYNLQTYVFPSNNYKAIYTSNGYTSTSQYTDALIFNVDSEYKSSLSTIPKGTFSTCSRLEEVYLPASITKIESKAFRNCNSLKHFASPGLQIIEQGAFEETWVEGTTSDNTELVRNGTTYGESDLYKKTGTTGILFDIPGTNFGGLNKNYTLCTYISTSPNHTNLILYKCNKKQIGGAAGGRYLYSIKTDTISISPYAFSGNYDFGNIGCYSDYNTGVSQDRLNYIGDFAFKSNTRLLTFRFPSYGSVNYLGEGAFYGCIRLSELYNFRHQPITKIQDYTFYNCGKDKYGIGASTDAGYSNLDFYIPDTVTEIGNYAFANCPQLMTIANLTTCNITSLGEGAFMNCFQNSTWRTKVGGKIALFTTALVCIAVAVVVGGFAMAAIGATVGTIGSIPAWGTIVGGSVVASELTDDTHVSWKEKRNQTSEVFLPQTISIGSKCFMGCKHLGKIILNYQMTQIPSQAFANCVRLNSILFSDGTFDAASEDAHVMRDPLITTIGEEAFLNCKNLSSTDINILLYNATTIKKNAFKGCSQTSKIIIPATVQTLEEGALGFDGKCEYVFVNPTPPQNVSSKVFKNSTTKKTVTIKFGSKEAYMAKFPQVQPDEFIQLSESDPYWKNLFS